MEAEEQVLLNCSSSSDISKWGAVAACGGMTVAYVAILYSPTVVLRLPPPDSFNQFMIRRFICALISSLLSLFLSSLLLFQYPHFTTQNWNIAYLLAPYGIQFHHFRAAVVYPTVLTLLMYTGSLLLKLLLMIDSWDGGWADLFNFHHIFYCIYNYVVSLASNIAAWRNLVVAPLTEELVFRACMIPLLLCGGFEPLVVVFLCPLFFSLAHLNHLLDLYSRKNYSIQKTSLAVGTQLAYTMIFGSYASFLFIRTGHLIAPLTAHILCNFMGLPIVYSKRGLVVTLAFFIGTIGFLWLLAPLTVPTLYNFRIDKCCFWHGYCTWRIQMTVKTKKTLTCDCTVSLLQMDIHSDFRQLLRYNIELFKKNLPKTPDP